MYRSKKSLRQRVENLARERRTDMPGADEMIGLEDDLSRALEAVVTLSPGDQEVIRLAAFEELSYAEIGEVLGISPGAARSKLYRARRELKEVFESQTDGGTP
jgi:RNA polymerase sigma-70 factor (ECF subfamily)